MQQSDLPKASKNLACTLFEQLLEPVEGAAGKAQTAKTQVGGQPTAQLPQVDPASRTVPRQYAADDSGSFGSLVGGGP